MFRGFPFRSSLAALVIVLMLVQSAALATPVAVPGEQLLMSTSSDRTAPASLQNAEVGGEVYIFVTVPNHANIVSVAFTFDGDRSTRRVDTGSPYDLAGTSPDGPALAFDVSSLGGGEHFIEANVRYLDRRQNLRAAFTVNGSSSTSTNDGHYRRSRKASQGPTSQPNSESPPPQHDPDDPRPQPDPDDPGPQPDPDDPRPQPDPDDPRPQRRGGPPPSDSRLGLHVTSDELAVWRQRSTEGPYRVQGDVSSNSPGDWTRILKYAAEFAADPGAGRWSGPVANNPGGCVVQVNEAADDPRYVPSHRTATFLRDAAFVAMVEEDADRAVTIRDELLAQATVRGVNFADRSRFCPDTIDGDNNPVFNISNWLTRLLYAYDYVNIAFPELFTTHERMTMDEWFAAAAEWMQQASDEKLDELFHDRRAGDYRLTDVAQNNWRDVLYLGGPQARTLQRRYNNRVAASMRFVGLVGVAQDDKTFINAATQFVREFIQFSYYPEGVLGEFERWTSDRPVLGWKYAVVAAGSLITIADALARTGDTSLYDYQTTGGALGTEGPHVSGAPKSLGTMVTDLMGYVDHSYQRYGTTDSSRRGDDRYLIDSNDDVHGDQFVHDTMLTMSNRYYTDPYVATIYQRTAPGAPAYPANPTHGQGDPEGGEWGTYPAALLMFGGLETAASPYIDAGG